MFKKAEKTATASRARERAWSAFTSRTEIKWNSVLIGRLPIVKFELLFLLVGVLITLSACGGSSGVSTTPTAVPPPPTTGAPTSTPTAVPPPPTTGAPTSTPTAVPPPPVPDPTQDKNAPILMVGPSSVADNCTDTQGVCTLSVFIQGQTSNPINWTATSTIPGVTFNPPNGTLTNDHTSDTVDVSSLPSTCQPGTFTFSAPGLAPFNVTMTCTTPKLTMNMTNQYDPNATDTLNVNNISASTPGCSQGNQAGTVTCQVTLAETADSQSSVQWGISGDRSEISYDPANGPLSPGQNVVITISGIPCNKGGTISVTGAPGGEASFFWTTASC